MHSEAGSPGADMQGTARSWRGSASLGRAPGTLQAPAMRGYSHGAVGLNPQSVSQRTRSILLACCQSALKRLSDGHKGPTSAREVAAIFISLPN